MQDSSKEPKVTEKLGTYKKNWRTHLWNRKIIMSNTNRNREKLNKKPSTIQIVLISYLHFHTVMACEHYLSIKSSRKACKNKLRTDWKLGKEMKRVINHKEGSGILSSQLSDPPWSKGGLFFNLCPQAQHHWAMPLTLFYCH